MFSIIIPAYNYAQTLARAVHSVAKQVQQDDEIWIIDDGSTDHTPSLAHSLCQQYAKVHYHRHSNRGLAATRNVGIELSSQPYLIFLDADDAMIDSALAIVRTRITHYPDIQVWIGNHTAVKEDHTTRTPTLARLSERPVERVKAYLLDKTLPISQGAIIMHRLVFDTYRCPAYFRNNEDLSVNVWLLATFNVRLIKEPLVRIDKHSDSLRHRVGYAKQVGMQLVEEVFCPTRLGAPFQPLKRAFAVQRYLSLSRTCFLAQQYPDCWRFFRKALHIDWRVIGRTAYSSKALRALLKRA